MFNWVPLTNLFGRFCLELYAKNSLNDRLRGKQMSEDLQTIFPWGRSFGEYLDMFALSDEDLEKSILGCGDGPAAFNVEMFRRGQSVISCDPLYEFSAEQIESRIEAAYDKIVDGARENQDRFVWDRIGSPEQMGQLRLKAMREFLVDYERGRQQGRYLSASLPELPFADGTFDLAISSHFLFTYSHLLSTEFHIQAILELCRVAKEVRIFPLLNFEAQPSEHLTELLRALAGDGMQTEQIQVDYEFQCGGNRMLKVWRS